MKTKTIVLAFSILLIMAGCGGKNKKVDEKSFWEEKNEQSVQTDSNKLETTMEESETKLEKEGTAVVKKETAINDEICQYPDIEAKSSMTDDEGADFYNKNFVFSESMKEIKGRGLFELTIEKDGSISNVVMIEKIHPDIDKEVERVLKLFPKYSPALKDGKAVRSKLYGPIPVSYTE